MRLLIIGMLEGHISTAGQIAISRGATVSQVDSIDAGLHALRQGQGADLVMIDIKLPITKFMKSMKGERMSTPVVACGVSNNPDAAVAAIKAGAKEYIPLPPNPEMIAAILKAVSEEQTSVIFKDPLMAGTLKLAAQIAPSDASVLVTGESGTGKEVLARFIHTKSKRSNEPFVSVNCAAIPDNLLESELFGHEKGAFTGAVARRVGKFEEADGGTLLLDEISEMDIRLQAKLLRAIQEREIDRVGGSKPVRVNIRLIATSNRDLEKHVRDEKFREDLYFRLNSIAIELPTLRERKSDIPLLIDFFLSKYTGQDGIVKIPSEEFIRILIDYDWPGNVRELENSIKKVVLMDPDINLDKQSIDDYLPKISKKIKKLENKVNYKKFIENIFTSNQLPNEGLHKIIIDKMEKTLIESILIKNKGDMGLSCTQLGLTKKMLLSKITKLDIDKKITQN